MVVKSLSSLTLVFRIFVRGFWWGLGLGVMTLNAYGSLIGCVFLCPLWPVSHPVLLPPLQLLPLHLLLLSGIVVSDISPTRDFPLLLVVVF